MSARPGTVASSSTLPPEMTLPMQGTQFYFSEESPGSTNQQLLVPIEKRAERSVQSSGPSFYKLIRSLRKKYSTRQRSVVRRESNIDHETGERLSGHSDSSSDVNRTGSAERVRKGVSFTPDTLVWDAIVKGSATELEPLLKNNVIDVNQISPNGDTLLHRAAHEGNLDILNILISYGGNPNQKNADGWPPIHYALQQAHLPAAIYLIECGTSIGEYTKLRVQEFNEVKEISSQVTKGDEVFV